jgi:hypothetical protein
VTISGSSFTTYDVDNVFFGTPAATTGSRTFADAG